MLSEDSAVMVEMLSSLLLAVVVEGNVAPVIALPGLWRRGKMPPSPRTWRGRPPWVPPPPPPPPLSGVAGSNGVFSLMPKRANMNVMSDDGGFYCLQSVLLILFLLSLLRLSAQQDDCQMYVEMFLCTN